MTNTSDLLKVKYQHDEIVRKLRLIMEGRTERSHNSINELNTGIAEYILGVEKLKKYCVENNGGRELCESCVILSNDAAVFENTLKHLSLSLSLNESRYGFYNPFDIMSDTNTLPSVDIDDKAKKGVDILGLRLWNQNRKGKVYYDGDSVYSGQAFYPDDTIELSPVRIFTNDELYSKTIRDVAFEIDKARRIYGLPFGYISFYKNSHETRKEPNADYECLQDDKGNYSIRIYATEKIPRNSEVVLRATEEDMANAVHPYDFRYDEPNRETLYKAKYKFA